MRNQLRPLFDRVVIKELDPDRVRRSGLIVPPGSEEPPPQHGIVLAVGPGLDWWENVGIAMPVRPGDHVVFPRPPACGSRSRRSGCSCAAWVSCSACSRPSRTAPAAGGRPLAAGESCPVCGREGSIA